MNKKIKKTKNRLYCSNCGRHGHAYKNCREPITSYGIINILISTDDNNIINRISNELSVNDGEQVDSKIYDIANDIIGVKFENPEDIKLFGTYTNNIKFLLVRRKYSLGFLEFLRGRYETDNCDGLVFLFRQMTKEEIKKIATSKFDHLWNELWHNSKNMQNTYQNEYAAAKNKFDKLKNMDNGTSLNLQFYIDNVTPMWGTAEWGFPKGRRMGQESDITCAIREFQEESGFIAGEYTVLDKILPLEETLIGTNGIHYKHIYYLTLSNTDRIPTIESLRNDNIDEVGDIGWFTFSQAIDMIREHHQCKKQLLSQIFTFTINTILNINKNKKSIV